MYIADLHIHSKYSRATSRDCDAPHLDLWARYKGIDVVGTGDFTHPAWRRELLETLEPAEEGLYRLRSECALPCSIAGEPRSPRFVLSGEISTIYKKDGRTRKVHHLIVLPGLEAAEELAHRLEAVGNLHSDGRPILGLDSRDLLEIVLESCPDALFIPAHIWTPHFSLFGAFSAFSSVAECYGDMSGHIRALETGLSSDPPMNRMLSMLDGYTLVSNSDAHSPAKLGREANLLAGEASYPAMKRAIETGEGFEGTIEFFPEEGKYHLDGHRNCACRLLPAQTRELGGLCPVCGRKLTVGVLHRVTELADRAEPLGGGKPFQSLTPLPELLGDCLSAAASSKRVQTAYFQMLERFGPEFRILREVPVEEIARQAGFAVSEGLKRLRDGRVRRAAGYDGEYGKITLFAPHELEALGGQTSMISWAEPPAQSEADSALLQQRTGAGKPSVAPFPAAPGAAAGDFCARADASGVPAGVSDAPRTDALNERQEEAARSSARVVVVVAGPGTGKTKTLVERIRYLIGEKGVSPADITAVTFTRQAAEEMRARLEASLGGARALRGLTIGTFHAIALTLIPAKPIVTREQAKAIMEDLLLQRGQKGSPAQALQQVSAVKNGLLPSRAFPLADAYGERLQSAGLRDLDDILLEALCVDVRGRRGFSYLLADEFQDINPVQRQLVEHWSENAKSLFVIGDPDQSIYGFRGADAACFDRLLAAHPGVTPITLRDNYRSSPAVVRCALHVISHQGNRERELLPHRPEGARVRVLCAADAFSEGVWIAKEIARMAGGVDMLDAHAQQRDSADTRAFSEIAVLCRTHRQLEQIEYCLVHDSIPCVICGREDFWEDGKVRGLLGFYRSLLTPDDSAALYDALHLLWKCPQPLIQRAQVAMRAAATDARALRQALQDFAPLLPWLDAVEALEPLLRKTKPRKLLEQLAAACGAEGRAVERMLNAAVFHNRMDAFLQTLLLGEEADVRRRAGAQGSGGAVRLATLHGAKGLEFPVVFVAGVAKGELPLERESRETDAEEERRLFFVGLTRARDELIVSYGGQPSEFVAEMPGDTLIQRARTYAAARKEEQLRLF